MLSIHPKYAFNRFQKKLQILPPLSQKTIRTKLIPSIYNREIPPCLADGGHHGAGDNLIRP
jgi:hypothetical protein